MVNWRLFLEAQETASDTASTESAMLEFAENYDFENIVLIQATSPLLKSSDLDEAIEKYDNFDSMLSVVAQKRFYWNYNEDGSVSPINYDFKKRPMRQQFKGNLVENGAFYICSKKIYLELDVVYLEKLVVKLWMRSHFMKLTSLLIGKLLRNF